MADKFNYTYTAPTESERREIEEIRRQYAADGQTDDKLKRLRRLDKLVNFPPRIAAGLTVAAGVLIFGAGMALCLQWALYGWGIAVSAVGAAALGASYPLYKFVLKRNKKRFGQEIIELSDELLKME